jgi:hypothetical protein
MNNDAFGINTPAETVMIHPVSMNEIPEVVDVTKKEPVDNKNTENKDAIVSIKPESNKVTQPAQKIASLYTTLNQTTEVAKKEGIPNILNEMNRGYVYGHDIESFTTVIRKLVEAAVKSDLTPSVLANLENYVCTKPEVYGFSNSDVEKYNKGVKILTATESELAQARVDQGLTNELKFGNALESISTEDKQKAI